MKSGIFAVSCSFLLGNHFSKVDGKVATLVRLRSPAKSIPSVLHANRLPPLVSPGAFPATRSASERTMVVVSIDLEQCDGLVNWRTVAQIPDEKPSKRRAERPKRDNDEDEDGDSGGSEPEDWRGGGGGGGIYDSIIAKWSSRGLPKPPMDCRFDDDGGRIRIHRSRFLQDYDLDDPLIDNSELKVPPCAWSQRLCTALTPLSRFLAQEEFEKKVISKRAQNMEDVGFRLEDEDEDEEGEDEDEDEEEDDEDEDGSSEGEEEGEGDGGEGPQPTRGVSGVGIKRRKRRTQAWGSKGKNLLRDVPEVRTRPIPAPLSAGGLTRAPTDCTGWAACVPCFSLCD